MEWHKITKLKPVLVEFALTENPDKPNKWALHKGVRYKRLFGLTGVRYKRILLYWHYPFSLTLTHSPFGDDKQLPCLLLHLARGALSVPYLERRGRLQLSTKIFQHCIKIWGILKVVNLPPPLALSAISARALLALITNHNLKLENFRALSLLSVSVRPSVAVAVAAFVGGASRVWRPMGFVDPREETPPTWARSVTWTWGKERERR